MKVSKVQIPTFIKNVALTAPLLFATNTAVAQNKLGQDIFEKSEKINWVDPNSYSPSVKLDGTTVYPKLVVDISDNMLYEYDTDQNLIGRYPTRVPEKDIKKGLNLIDITTHDYGRGKTTPKIMLTKVNRINGKPDKAPSQVIVGCEGKTIKDDPGIFTNVILVDNKSALELAKKLKEYDFVLIRK